MKWVVIQTNIAQHPEEPIIKEFETTDGPARFDELQEILDREERNDMNITAVPLTQLLIALGYIESDETETVE